jgi:hypothetical protein
MAQETTDVLLAKFGYPKNKNWVLIPFISMLMFVNIGYYFYDFNPQDKGSDQTISFQRYPNISKRDTQLTEKLKYIRENVSPQNSLIVASSSFFMQAMYYLPEYHVYLFNGITHENNTLVRYGHNFKRQNFYDFDTSDLFFDNYIERVVFFDDAFNKWIDAQAPKETVSIAGRYQLTIVYPDKDNRLEYSYHNIQIK